MKQNALLSYHAKTERFCLQAGSLTTMIPKMGKVVFKIFPHGPSDLLPHRESNLHITNVNASKFTGFALRGTS